MTQHDPHIYISKHPIVQDRLSVLRDKNSTYQQFRGAIKDISLILAMEACGSLELKSAEVTTPICKTNVQRLAYTTSPLIVPILRAGLGLTNGFEVLLPDVDTGHIGLYRDEETHLPVEYLKKLPADLKRPIFVVDPMLATGHSMEKAIEVLLEDGADIKDIICVVLLAVPEGISVLRKKWPNLPVFTAAVDERLNENAYIVPGLGDAGDRIFGTVNT